MNRRRFLRETAALSAAAFAAASGETMAEDDQTTISLAGTWAFREDRDGIGTTENWPVRPTADAAEWTAATVPGCWERDGIAPATFTGPGWYRRDVAVPSGWAVPGRRRLWWELDAVSYHADGWAGGRALGAHTGMWDGWAWEIPNTALQNGTLALALRVEKPGGRFAVPETMAGFLPYVWGTWGGPWQETRLRRTGPAAILRVWAPGRADGTIAAEADLDLTPGTEALVRFEVRDPAGKIAAARDVSAKRGGTVAARLTVPKAALWDTDSPTLYTLVVTAGVGGQVSDVRTRRVGFRDITVEDEQIRLNGRPIHFRAPLSWGWYDAVRAPNPSPKVFEDELRRVRALGFNGMKLCLWIPPASYFEIADALGMLLWVELPMWLPKGTAFARAQTPAEYARIVRQVGDHASVALWTIGCEIGKGVDAAFLGGLTDQVKRQTGSNLVRDNSGSAECYGGPLPEHADYWDFHLYCDLPFARPTFEAFAPRWREKQPWLFGEFNDQDALRDLAKHPEPPWWSQKDPANNPQGVRWEMGVVDQAARVKAAGLEKHIDALRESSRRQALLARKHTLELTRAYPFMTGYVVTGLVDTPISTAGLFDDFGDARFSPAEFTPFNADTVLFIEPDRRRAWTAGGDRPSFLDRNCIASGDTVRRHIGVSHYGRENGKAILNWGTDQSGGGGGATLDVPRLSTGDVTEIGLIEFPAPSAPTPRKITLGATLELSSSGRRVVNAWPIWVFPKPAKDEKRRVGVFDPAGKLDGFADAVGITPSVGTPDAPALVATAWRPEMLDYVRGGGRLLLIQDGVGSDGLPAVAVPFWRESMRLFDAAHPSWGAFPHESQTDFVFYGLAGDTALDIEKVGQTLGVAPEPVLRRVDARSFAVHAYVLTARLGQGTMLVTTLRPQGGLGDQPSGLGRNIAGAFLLRTWLDWLGERTT